MFKFGDYTLAEGAELWDCTEESILDSWRQSRLPLRRQYWLFGPWLFDQQTAEEMAPTIRHLMKRQGTTRADREARQRALEQSQARLEETQRAIAELERQRRENHEQFFQKMKSLIEERRKRDLEGQ